MKALEYMQQIKKMEAQIDANILEIARLEALATATTSALGGERVQASGSQEKMADCVVKIVDMQNQLNKEIDRFIDLKKEARELIAKGCDADCFKLLHKRYFHYQTWEQIAVEMGFTYQWVSTGLHRRALSQLQKALDERSEKYG